MRPHLVRINSTIVEQAPYVFNIILVFEITLCCIILLVSPMFCIASSRVGAIHRNFRCQLCSAVAIYFLGICARFVLIYYQIFDIPLTGYAPFIINITYLAIALTCSVSAFFFTSSKNARQLDSLSKSKISHASYTVGRSFQIRENILLMKYIVHLIVPSAIISSPCFICFAFNEYGPEDWLLSRSIAYAVWDLFFVIFRVCYLYREITKHPLILREFRNLGVMQLMRRRVIRPDEASSVVPKMEMTYTQTYFDQFKEAWR